MPLPLLPLRTAWGLRRAGASCEPAWELQPRQRSPCSAAAFPPERQQPTGISCRFTSEAEKRGRWEIFSQFDMFTKPLAFQDGALVLC